jgi:hypothetical protein
MEGEELLCTLFSLHGLQLDFRFICEEIVREKWYHVAKYGLLLTDGNNCYSVQEKQIQKAQPEAN